MSDYWIDSPDNPFNQMSWTRGGGGYDNGLTAESNERRADAMQGAGAAALPHFATMGVAQAVLKPGSLAVVGDNVVRTSGARRTGSKGGSGPGSASSATTPGGANSPSPKGAGGKGAGSRLVVSNPDEAGATYDRQQIGGENVDLDLRFPAVEDWWEPWFGEPGEWVGGIVNGVMAVEHNTPKYLEDNFTVQPGSAADWAISGGPQRALDWLKNTPITSSRAVSEGFTSGMGYDEWATMQTFAPDPEGW